MRCSISLGGSCGAYQMQILEVTFKAPKPHLLRFIGVLQFHKVYDGNPHIQESPHPRAPKSPKSLKKDFPGLPARSVKKVTKKSPNTDFVVFLTPFRVIWDFFDTFLTLRAGRPGNTFLRLFGDFGPREPRNSCIWRLQSQHKVIFLHYAPRVQPVWNNPESCCFRFSVIALPKA